MMIYPKVKQIVYGPEIDTIKGCFFDFKTIDINLQYVISCYFESNQKDGFKVEWVYNEEFEDEEYSIHIGSSIFIEYRTYNAQVYAIYTLYQLYKQGLSKEVWIHDLPSLKLRGFMLDISRNKIPTIEEIKRIIRKLSFLKMNHLELYIEGFSFYDSTYPQADYKDSLTKEEFKSLQEYAAIFAIDLVPNMNGLGHMSSWLKIEEFKSLAEKEDGFIQWGNFYQPSTLYPKNPLSLELVKKLYLPLLETSSSTYFHMNLDEPFELGQGKSKEIVEREGKAKVYLDWVNQLSEYVKEHHKKPLMWADVIFQHPESIKDCPQDIIYFDWGYDKGYPFKEHAEILSSSNLTYVLCPGTSSWNSFTSRYEDMYQTTMEACKRAKEYGGLGAMTTDWGDHGHIQPIVFSYLGMITLALESWRDTLHLDVIEIMNDLFINNHDLSVTIYNLSQYSLFENIYVYNGTMMFFPMMYSAPDDSKTIEQRSERFLNGLHQRMLSLEAHNKIEEDLNSIKKNCPISATTENKEVRLMIDILELMNDIHFHYNHQSTPLQQPSQRIDNIKERHKEIWLLRNRYSYLDDTLKRWDSLKEIINYLG